MMPEVPCGTVTLAGATKAVFELEMPMTRLLVGAFDIATVQRPVDPTAIFVGVQISDDMFDGATRPIAAVCELLPSVAVTVAL